jgi:hemolysin activation/secretion protein
MESRRRLAWVVLMALGATAALAAPPPSGGELLQQVPPPAPVPQAAPPVVTVTRPEPGSAAPGDAFPVQHIDITGASAVPMAVLRAIVAPSEGTMLSLADLQRLADAITAQYRKAGYPFSQAYVPAQTVRDGRVSIAVLEAHYDNFVLRNSSPVRDLVPQAVLSELKVGMPVDQASLDRVLLLISDLPATEVKGTLRPGETPGGSELQVDVAPGPLYNGNVSADDYGNAATGRERLNVNVNLLEPLRLGDVLSASALSAGSGMNYGRLGYEIPLHGPATQLEAHVSTLGYKLVNGREVALDARGTASVFGLGIDQILLRSTSANVTARLTYEDTQLDDKVEVSAIRTKRHTEDWRALVAGGVNDSSGVSTFSVGVTVGRVVYDDPSALVVDYGGARTEGSYTKYVLGLSRLQRIGGKTALYAALSYQGANKNLDSSEQFFAGGPNSVEAYDNGVLSGTQGNSQTLELRRDLHAGPNGYWQGKVFLDHAQVQIEKDAFSPGTNLANLSGTGVGLSWTGPRAWSAISSIAVPIGAAPELIGNRPSLRFWVQVQKAF